MYVVLSIRAYIISVYCVITVIVLNQTKRSYPAVLGRINDANGVADWQNLPSTKRGESTSKDGPPMWLPRAAFKVLIRKSKFLGWPNDTKTGRPVGGEELKSAEESRISRPDAIIGDAAIDAVFDSWSWGASIATPDKVANTLKLIKPNAGGKINNQSNNEIDLDAFVSAAIRGRSNTLVAAAIFVVIQLVVLCVIVVGPLVEAVTGNVIFPR